MDWQTIRQLYPHRWLVVEAIDARTDEQRGKRIINQLEVIEVFGDDSKPAWECYSRLHDENKWREYYFLHTDREELDIKVQTAFRHRIKGT
jgi:hypothetical protein